MFWNLMHRNEDCPRQYKAEVQLWLLHVIASAADFGKSGGILKKINVV